MLDSTITCHQYYLAIQWTWWVVRDSNSRQPACKAGTLPTELTTQKMERIGEIESHSAQLGRLATHLVLTRIIWHPDRDSNPNQQFWRLLCCHYTIEIFLKSLIYFCINSALFVTISSPEDKLTILCFSL